MGHEFFGRSRDRPSRGGALLEHFWWGSVFLLAVPVMVLLLAIGPLVLPEFRDPEPRRIDG
jgi:DHA2 family multidrug resistance protein-like MFS transporter